MPDSSSIAIDDRLTGPAPNAEGELADDEIPWSVTAGAERSMDGMATSQASRLVPGGVPGNELPFVSSIWLARLIRIRYSPLSSGPQEPPGGVIRYVATTSAESSGLSRPTNSASTAKIEPGPMILTSGKVPKLSAFTAILSVIVIRNS